MRSGRHLGGADNSSRGGLLKSLLASLVFLTCFLQVGGADGTGAEIRVAAFGAKGDGITDDAAAVGKAVRALIEAPKPAVLRFEAGRTYRVSSGSGFVIALQNQERITIEGAGATLLLDGGRRGISLFDCRHVTVRGLRLDYDPLPFAEALVTAVEPAARSLRVRIEDGFAVPPPGGPTRTNGEQAYFAMLWNPGPHALVGRHYWLADLMAVPDDMRVLRAVAADNFNDFGAVRPGVTRISLPVRGIAHQHGDGAVLQVDSSREVLMEEIEIWSAPWFACVVQRNESWVTFRRVNVRPKPGTRRISSSWRDGIHVKGNRATLLFEDCVLDGMNDDSFNIATHLSRVEDVDGPRVRVRQNFPLGYVPWRVGDTLAAYGSTTGAQWDQRRVVAIKETPVRNSAHAPTVSLTLDAPLPGLAMGDQVWSMEAANPRTTLRRCTIRNSCRFQSPVTMEACDVSAFLWFYGEHIEGPLPSGSVVRDSRLRLGRGNPELAVACNGRLNGLPKPAAVAPVLPLANLRFENNEIDGRLELQHAREVRLLNNRFDAARGRLTIRDCRDVLLQGNRLGKAAFSRERIDIQGQGTRESVVIQ